MGRVMWQMQIKSSQATQESGAMLTGTRAFGSAGAQFVVA